MERQCDRDGLTYAIHKQHPLGQILVEEYILHPEVQWKEEADFILGWKPAHISGSKCGHTLGMQGAGARLLSVGHRRHCTHTVIMLSPGPSLNSG